MPLRDHFRPPVSSRHSWEGFHAQWPAMLVQRLFPNLPVGYTAEPRVRLGRYYELNDGSSKDSRLTSAPCRQPWTAAFRCSDHIDTSSVHVGNRILLSSPPRYRSLIVLETFELLMTVLPAPHADLGCRRSAPVAHTAARVSSHAWPDSCWLVPTCSANCE